MPMVRALLRISRKDASSQARPPVATKSYSPARAFQVAASARLTASTWWPAFFHTATMQAMLMGKIVFLVATTRIFMPYNLERPENRAKHA
jgi:hypothetical protein